MIPSPFLKRGERREEENVFERIFLQASKPMTGGKLTPLIAGRSRMGRP